MASTSSDLNGSAPDDSPVALLLIDLISDMEFDGGDSLFEQALPAARKIAELKKRAKAEGIPTIYVNDNYGRWQSDLTKIVERACRSGARGREIAELLRPAEDDYFVLKPKHSAFFSTTLATLLEHLGARTIILTGVDANVCILYTAGDAHMRDYRVVVPSDCVASRSREATEWAFQQMRHATNANRTPSERLDLKKLMDGVTGVTRLAEARDAEQIQRIYAPVVRDTAISFELEIPTVEEMGARIHSTAERELPWLVYETAGDVLGYAYASRFRERAAYRWSVEVSVYVHPEARGARLGRKLYAALFGVLALQRYQNAYAGTALPNPASVRLHEVMGFNWIGTYHAVGYKFGKWQDVLWWERPLLPPGSAPEPVLSLAAAREHPAWLTAV